MANARYELPRSVYIPSASGTSIMIGVPTSVPTHDVWGLYSIHPHITAILGSRARSKMCSSDLTVSNDPSGNNTGGIVNMYRLPERHQLYYDYVLIISWSFSSSSC